MFLNNCCNRNHVHIYGADAFYDLGTNGYQNGLARDLRKGDLCIVANYEDMEKKRAIFSWYSFISETLDTDENGEIQRVLRGSLQRSESMTKIEAAADARYGQMFDVLGRFKQAPVLPFVMRPWSYCPTTQRLALTFVEAPLASQSRECRLR